MAITEIPSQRPFDEGEFRRRLSEEYKTLQDKMDKIGGFRFTVKGWSVTAVIAASAASTASKSLATALTISVGVAFMLTFFFYFEFEQVRLSRLFGNRAKKLEETFRILDRNRGATPSAPIFVPYIAHEIGQSRYKQRLQKQSSRGLSRFLRLKESWQEWWREQRPQWWQGSRQADIWFYAALVILSLCALAPRHQAIYDHMKHWRAKPHESRPVAPRLPCSQSGVPEC